MIRRLLPTVPALIAMVVLYGWVTGDETLIRIGLTTVPMNPTTAAVFIALSFAISARRYGGRFGRGIAVALFGATMAVGVTKLVGLANFHIRSDVYLFVSKLGMGGVPLTRMSPNAALCFVLIALALLIKRYRSDRFAVLSQVLALLVAMIALFATAGHIYGVRAFYGLPAFTPMAIHTAASFLCLAAFVFLQTVRRGLSVPIMSAGPGGRSARILLPAAVVIPIAFGWLRLQGERIGLYPPEIGIALTVIMNVVSLSAVIWWSARLLLDADVRRMVAEAELARLVSHDFLTGLPNRARFMERLLGRMTARERHPDRPFALVYLGFDGFEQVNDRLGHASGDALLRQFADILRQYVPRKEDMVARLDDDEFVLLLDEIGSVEDAASLAGRIVAELPPNFGRAGQLVPIGVDVGIVVADLRHLTPESLLNDADRAMYRARRSGKGRYALFSEEDPAA